MKLTKIQVGKYRISGPKTHERKHTLRSGVAVCYSTNIQQQCIRTPPRRPRSEVHAPKGCKACAAVGSGVVHDPLAPCVELAGRFTGLSEEISEVVMRAHKWNLDLE